MLYRGSNARGSPSTTVVLFVVAVLWLCSCDSGAHASSALRMKDDNATLYFGALGDATIARVGPTTLATGSAVTLQIPGSLSIGSGATSISDVASMLQTVLTRLNAIEAAIGIAVSPSPTLAQRVAAVETSLSCNFYDKSQTDSLLAGTNCSSAP